MRYFGSQFTLTLCGLRLRLRVDLDDVDDRAPAERRRVRVVRGSLPHHARVSPRAGR